MVLTEIPGKPSWKGTRNPDWSETPDRFAIGHTGLMRKLSLQYKKIEQKCTIWRVTCWSACICALHLNGSRKEMPKWTIRGAAGGPVLPPLRMHSSLWKLMREHLGEQIQTVWIPFSCLFSDFTVWKFLLLLFMLCHRLSVWCFMSRPNSQSWEATIKNRCEKKVKGWGGWEHQRCFLWFSCVVFVFMNTPILLL